MAKTREPNDERAVATTGDDRQVAQAQREDRPDLTRRITPACDAYETGDRIVILADMPGVDREGVEVTLYRGTLTLRGRVKRPVPAEFRPYRRADLDVVYQRSLSLLSSIDPDSVEAKVQDGVLRVELTKPAEERPRRIAITRG